MRAIALATQKGGCGKSTLAVGLALAATETGCRVGIIETDADRWARLLLGPAQFACYCAFIWAALILLSRFQEVRRQRRAFALPLLPTEDGARILHEDARPLLRQLDQTTAGRCCGSCIRWSPAR